MDCHSSSTVSSGSSTYSISATHERIYVAWINSQLRKAGCAQISKLLECADGKALLSLMEVLSGEKLSDSISASSSRAQGELERSKNNKFTNGEKDASEIDVKGGKLKRIEIVLGAMLERRIRMSPVNAVDVINGDQRAIMRVVLALAAHFKPTTSRMQHDVPNSLSLSTTNGTSGQPVLLDKTKRDRTWQSLHDSTNSTNCNAKAKRTDDDALAKPSEEAVSGRFERSMTFDGAHTLVQHDDQYESEQNTDIMSISQYSKLSDTEKLNTAARRGTTKRQEWLEQRRRRNLSGSSTVSASVDSSCPSKPPDSQAASVCGRTPLDESLKYDHEFDCDAVHEPKKQAEAVPTGTLSDVRETRALLTKLQRTILLNRVLDDIDAEAARVFDVAPANESARNGECDTDAEGKLQKAHTMAEADCVVLRSRLDVALAKQREMAFSLQHLRMANANLVRTNAALRARLGETDSDPVDTVACADGEIGIDLKTCNQDAERVAHLESELNRLRCELRTRDRLIVDLLGGSDALTHLNGHFDAQKVTSEEVDELSELTSRSLSAYSPSHEHVSSFAFDALLLPPPPPMDSGESHRVSNANADTDTERAFTNGEDYADDADEDIL